MNKRDLKLGKYGISGKRYKELCGFCEQYPDWKQEIKNYTFISGKPLSGMPSSPNRAGSQTEEAAFRLDRFLRNCQIVEETAKEADEEHWEEIIKSACYGVPTTYLINVDNMPLSKSVFYDRRRYFFFLLDKKRP